MPLAGNRYSGDVETGHVRGGIARVLETLDDQGPMTAQRSAIGGGGNDEQSREIDAGEARQSSAHEPRRPVWKQPLQSLPQSGARLVRQPPAAAGNGAVCK